MAVTSNNIKQKILKEKTDNNVKCPLLFSLERKSKISYLLGTCHAMPLKSLPKACHDVFDQCTFFVTEEIDLPQEKILSYYLKSVVRSASSAPWVHQLPSHIVTFLEKRIAIYYDQHHYEPIRKTIHQLKIWAAYQFAEDGHLILLNQEECKRRNELAEGERRVSMDCALIERFADKNGGLESVFDKIPGYKLVGGTIKDLKVLYEDMTSDLEESTEYGDKTLTDLLDSYQQGRDLYDPYNVLEETSDKITVARTIRWLPNIIKHHHSPDEIILFGVGSTHLIGEYGLLSLLPKLGFSISRLTINGTFEPYVYPFNSEIIARRTLAQEHRMSPCVEGYNRRMILHQYTKLHSKPIEIIDSFISEQIADSAPGSTLRALTKKHMVDHRF